MLESTIVRCANWRGWRNKGNEAICKLVNSGEKEGEHKRGRWARVGAGEITIDSAADESCWPVEDDGLFSKFDLRRKISS